jgi:hypothetical protein
MSAPTATRTRGPRPTREAQMREELTRQINTVELLTESLADLERQFAEPGWIRMTAQLEREFSPEGLVQLRAACRLYGLKNPLLKRGLGLRSAYVWGQGVEIAARADGHDDEEGEQDVNAVVQAFLDNKANRRAVTGPSARDQLEHALGTDGEVYIALFTKPLSGAVQARVLLADEIADVICNPDDASDPWYYRRQWTENGLSETTGIVQPTMRTTYYPAVGYRPASRPSAFAGHPIAWDAPVVHVAANRPLGWKRGVPDAYAAIDWARAYKEFLEDWARLMRSLSRFAWKATTPGSKAAAVKARLAQAPGRGVGGESEAAGATAVLPPDVALEAISKSGATIDAGSGRPLAMMVAAALGVPVTMLLADPGQTGARATAETLDTPTELTMHQRRALWTEAYQTILDYVIAEAVRAPKGKLAGKITRDDYDQEVVILDGDTPTTVDITWPDLDDVDPLTLVQAIVQADTTGTVRPEEILRLLLTALGVHNVDELIAAQLDDDGNFIWPKGPPGAAGPAAATAARFGQDPAQVDGGPMVGDEIPATDTTAGDGEPADTGDGQQPSKG